DARGIQEVGAPERCACAGGLRRRGSGGCVFVQRDGGTLRNCGIQTKNKRLGMQIEVGKRQKLKVIKKVDFGVYLAPGAEDGEKVLLPAKQVPAVCSVGDELEV